MTGALFGSRPVPTAAPAPKPPGLTDPLTQVPGDETLKAMAATAGRASTILTSGMGDTSTAIIRKQTLGG